MEKFLSDRGYNFRIFIAHQADAQPFNRGKLKNIAFDVARSQGFDTFAFHDIDQLPDDDSCDYTYPEDAPKHLSAYLSQYDYKLLFPENFGGVVLFSREQFERINGYYNEYWNWGAEDDDLYFRCRKEGYVDVRYCYRDYGTRTVARFNGQSSRMQVPATQHLDSMRKGSYTVTAVVRVCRRDDVDPYLFGDKDSRHVSIPILSVDGRNILMYGNTSSFVGAVWDATGHGVYPWVKRDEDLWTHVAVIFDIVKKEIRVLVNGRDLDHGNVGTLDNGFCDLSSLPFDIGYCSDTDIEAPTHAYFKGDIAELSFYSRALTEEEVAKQFADSQACESACVARYDFSKGDNGILVDLSGNENHGQIFNIEFVSEKVDRPRDVILPSRRMGRFSSLAHVSEGIQNNTYVQKHGAINESILVKQVYTGFLDTKKHGLSNLRYELLSLEPLSAHGVMVNVKC